MPLGTRTESAPSRLKACIACTHSKRRCDRRQPECERCIDRDVDCVYPQPKKRRRVLLEQGGRIQYVATDDPSSDPSSDSPSRGLETWSVLRLDRGWTELTGSTESTTKQPLPSIPPSLGPDSAPSAPGTNPSAGPRPLVPQGTGTRWFLAPETWSIEYGTGNGPAVPIGIIKDFLKGVQAMLREWVTEGSNGFVHKRLYRAGLPSCLQDAYTTLTAYISRTPATAELVLQIAEDRATALITQILPNEDLQANLLAHISRVQALFVYQVIRLLDGCVRQRALAEGHVTLLCDWICEMWRAASAYQASLHLSSGPPDERTSEYNATVALWSAWVLTESVRRTYLVVGFTLNVYMVLRDGWTECTGGVMLTARRGLWEADSASQWLELCQSKDPWLVSSISGQTLFGKEQMEDVDDFPCHLWTIVTEEEKVQGWIKRSRSRLEMLAL
ncbi:hypothetical protein GQ53DRAFT_751180 [Thozetella sp. PMI_491]|nr:hypothetical protein GQ53DRAFT_751180 [Thozetella sp. PMI_491]